MCIYELIYTCTCLTLVEGIAIRLPALRRRLLHNDLYIFDVLLIVQGWRVLVAHQVSDLGFVPTILLFP